MFSVYCKTRGPAFESQAGEGVYNSYIFEVLLSHYLDLGLIDGYIWFGYLVLKYPLKNFQITPNIRRIPPYDKQRGQSEGPQVVGEQPRRQHGDGLATV